MVCDVEGNINGKGMDCRLISLFLAVSHHLFGHFGVPLLYRA